MRSFEGNTYLSLSSLIMAKTMATPPRGVTSINDMPRATTQFAGLAAGEDSGWLSLPPQRLQCFKSGVTAVPQDEQYIFFPFEVIRAISFCHPVRRVHRAPYGEFTPASTRLL